MDFFFFKSLMNLDFKKVFGKLYFLKSLKAIACLYKIIVIILVKIAGDV